MTNITRRQHYVWRHHLEAWARSDGKVPTRRAGKFFTPNPINIGQQRDFYKVPRLSVEDEEFVRRLIIQPMENELFRDSAEGWLRLVAMPSRIRRTAAIRGLPIIGNLKKDLERAEIELEEKLHMTMEGNFVHYLSMLRGGDASFWSDGTDLIPFFTFVGLQVTRTKRTLENTVARMPQQEAARMRRIWPIARLSLGCNLGGSLFLDRERWKLRIINAPVVAPFITGDQPMFNLIPPVGHDGISLFYPVTPSRAMLLEISDNPSYVGEGDDLTEAQVEHLNIRMAQTSLEMIFGRDETYLRSLPASGLAPEVTTSG